MEIRLRVHRRGDRGQARCRRRSRPVPVGAREARVPRSLRSAHDRACERIDEGQPQGSCRHAMSNHKDEDRAAERMLTQLFAHAKPRPPPPAADTEEIRRAVYAEWDAVTGRRVWRMRASLAAAASVLLAVGLWIGGGLRPAAPPAAVARVERVQG